MILCLDQNRGFCTSKDLVSLLFLLENDFIALINFFARLFQSNVKSHKQNFEHLVLDLGLSTHFTSWRKLFFVFCKGIVDPFIPSGINQSFYFPTSSSEAKFLKAKVFIGWFKMYSAKSLLLLYYFQQKSQKEKSVIAYKGMMQ